MYIIFNVLYFATRCFTGSAEVIKPVSSLPHLRSLRLHDSLKELSNPFYMRQSYKTELLKLLPNLRELDGEVVKGPGKLA